MPDVTNWVQAGVAVLMMGGGLWGVIEARSSRAHRNTHTRIDQAEARLVRSIESETADRKREIARVDDELGGISELRASMGRVEGAVTAAFEKTAASSALVGQQVSALAERFGDYKTSQDRASEELKHSVRGLQSQVQSLAVTQASGRRSPQTET